MKKKGTGIVIFVLMLALIGFRFYRKYDREQQQKETQKANRELYLKVQKQQRELEYKAQQEAAQVKRDSAFKAEKKKRDAQIQQMREAVKKLEEEERKQQ